MAYVPDYEKVINNSYSVDGALCCGGISRDRDVREEG